MKTVLQILEKGKDVLVDLTLGVVHVRYLYSPEELEVFDIKMNFQIQELKEEAKRFNPTMKWEDKHIVLNIVKEGQKPASMTLLEWTYEDNPK